MGTPGISGVGHSRESLELGTPGSFWGWALGVVGVGHSRSALQKSLGGWALGSPGRVGLGTPGLGTLGAVGHSRKGWALKGWALRLWGWARESLSWALVGRSRKTLGLGTPGRLCLRLGISGSSPHQNTNPQYGNLKKNPDLATLPFRGMHEKLQYARVARILLQPPLILGPTT